MSHNAVAVLLRRWGRTMEVGDRAERAKQQEADSYKPPADPIEKTARALLDAYSRGGEWQRQADEFLKTAHPSIKAKMYEIAGVTSPAKQRRSRKTNGY